MESESGTERAIAMASDKQTNRQTSRHIETITYFHLIQHIHRERQQGKQVNKQTDKPPQTIKYFHLTHHIPPLTKQYDQRTTKPPPPLISHSFPLPQHTGEHVPFEIPSSSSINFGRWPRCSQLHPGANTCTWLSVSYPKLVCVCAYIVGFCDPPLCIMICVKR